MKTNSPDIKKLYGIARLCLAISAIGIISSSCSDETLDSGSGSRKIRFEVNTVETRSNNTTRSQQSAAEDSPVITLREGKSPLYLVPEAREGINTQSLTRGTMLGNDNMENFGIFASMAGRESAPDYMYNEEVRSDLGWAPQKEYLWPGEGALHLNAYSPFAATAGSQGITALPSPSNAGELTIGYTVPGDVTDQQDLLRSDPVDASSSPCHLTFNHALAAIRFAAGSELAPCRIVEITISGIENEGTLNLETGEWTDKTGNVTFTVKPDITLAAEENSEYVAPGTPITTGDNILFMLPQNLTAEAKVSLTIEADGTSTSVEASLDGQIWEAGKTTTYRLSANPNKETLILDVTGNFRSVYTGSTDSFSVKSSLSKGAETIPVNWIAEFVDDDGNVINRPEWISDFPLSGIGDTDCEAVTTMQDIVFDQISPQSQILQSASDINQTSGNTPYNLSSASGASGVENTANTYIINAPGRYSLPLVYGNAIKNNAANTAAYSATTHSSSALKTFVNHLGNAITDPYIYNNTGCVPADAMLVWEDELNLVRNVSLSPDGKTISFDVPHNTIRQGNAIIAVRDKDENIMWSWQIWVTDYNPAQQTYPLTVSGKTHQIYMRSVGGVVGGDVTTFKERSVKVRFSQTDVPAGLAPLQQTVEFTQTGITISTPDCYTYYQWGRKDPMISDIKQWYDASHKELTTLTLKAVDTEIPAGETYEAVTILQPDVFWTSGHTYSYQHTNLWNMNLSTTAPVKTIYDPSPVGSMVPERNLYRDLITGSTLTYLPDASGSKRAGYYISHGGEELWFPSLGYRGGSNGASTDQKHLGEYWTCTPVGHSEAGALVLKNTNGTLSSSIEQEPRAHGFGVRPVLE